MKVLTYPEAEKVSLVITPADVEDIKRYVEFTIGPEWPENTDAIHF